MNILEGIEYRDPLFGIMVLIFCIGIVSLFAYYYNYIISQKKQKELGNFIKSFDYIGFDTEVKEFLALSPNPIPSLLFMAKMYQKSANYEKAIRLYATLLDSIQNPLDKIPILESLGFIYEKAGFPLRAKEIYLQILKHYPRNPLILKTLIKIYEKLNSFEEALKALECLEELQGNTHLHQFYLKAKILIFSKTNSKNKEQKLLKILHNEPRLARIILEFFRDFYPTLFWDNLTKIPKENLLNIQDLIWNLKEIPQSILLNLQNLPQNAHNKLLKDILEAKGFLPLSITKKETFELEILCLLRTKNTFQGDLRFNFQCLNCKGESPLSFERCPHCGELLNSKTLAFLKEKQDEVCYSFL